MSNSDEINIEDEINLSKQVASRLFDALIELWPAIICEGQARLPSDGDCEMRLKSTFHSINDRLLAEEQETGEYWLASGWDVVNKAIYLCLFRKISEGREIKKTGLTKKEVMDMLSDPKYFKYVKHSTGLSFKS